LFDYASEAYELLQEEFTPDKYDKIDAILEKLRDYTMLINKFIQFVDKFLMLNLLGKNLFVLDGFHIRFFI